MSALSKPRSGTLRATLLEIEPGLYRAQYSGELNPENPDQREIPDFHLGTNAASVRQWVEEMASGLGYDRVVWE